MPVEFPASHGLSLDLLGFATLTIVNLVSASAKNAVKLWAFNQTLGKLTFLRLIEFVGVFGKLLPGSGSNMSEPIQNTENKTENYPLVI